jgi:hypothetical protein
MSPEALTPDDRLRDLLWEAAVVGSSQGVLPASLRQRFDAVLAERAARQEAADTSGLRWTDLLDDIIGLWATGQPDKDDVLDVLAEYRAAVAAGATERPLDVGCEICGTTEGTSEADRHAWLHP